MAKKIHLTIPTPCHENWDNMRPVDKDRFCGSCQKLVVDFTGMSDEQLIAFFNRPATGSVCGRLIPGQLTRDIAIPKKRIPWAKYFFQFAIPTFLMSLKATAQGEVRVVTKDTVVHAADAYIRGNIMVHKQVQHEISGRILNWNEEGIAGIIVCINDTSYSTVTDSSGYFKLLYGGAGKKIKIKASGDGFEPAEKTIRPGKKADSRRYVELTLTKKENEIVSQMGYVLIDNKE